MRAVLGLAAACVFTLAAEAAQAADGDSALTKANPITSTLKALAQAAPDWSLQARLYHGGQKGMSSRDSLGCKVVALRTVAIDPRVVPKRTILFIKESVGLPLPGGGVHDGLWYASDTGGAIKGSKIDLFTGFSKASMKTVMALNLKRLTVSKVGKFDGCPPA